MIVSQYKVEKTFGFYEQDLHLPSKNISGSSNLQPVNLHHQTNSSGLNLSVSIPDTKQTTFMSFCIKILLFSFLSFEKKGTLTGASNRDKVFGILGTIYFPTTFNTAFRKNSQSLMRSKH